MKKRERCCAEKSKREGEKQRERTGKSPFRRGGSCEKKPPEKGKAPKKGNKEKMRKNIRFF